MTDRKIRIVVSLVLTFAYVSASAQQPIQSNGTSECERLLEDYAYYRDRFDADNFANLFTEDVYLGRAPGYGYTGRQAMHDLITGRGPETNMTMFGGMRLDAVDSSTVEGTLYGVVLKGELIEEGEPALVIGQPGAEATYSRYEVTCKLVDADTGWKISSLSLTTLFVVEPE